MVCQMYIWCRANHIIQPLQSHQNLSSHWACDDLWAWVEGFGLSKSLLTWELFRAKSKLRIGDKELSSHTWSKPGKGSEKNLYMSETRWREPKVRASLYLPYFWLNQPQGSETLTPTCPITLERVWGCVPQLFTPKAPSFKRHWAPN